MAESYMKTLKHEEVDAGAYDNLAHAGAAIGEFIETIYDRRRLHAALDYLSPVEFEISQISLIYVSQWRGAVHTGMTHFFCSCLSSRQHSPLKIGS